jgi:N-acyl-phosphatidylethanolamine-hydrolysing phospholipase D
MLQHIRRAARGVTAAFMLSALAAVAGCAGGKPADPAPTAVASHHAPGGGFRNPAGSPTWQPETFDFVRFIVRRFTAEAAPERILPENFVVPHGEAVAHLAAASNPSLTWIGHDTFLIRVGGLKILTDPFFSERASPVGFAGPQRMVPPGVEIDDLPPLDAIVISHNHYDHFDVQSLAKIAKRSPQARVLVPLGLGDYVRRAGLDNVREMDWYDTDVIGGVEFMATPAIHRSNRGLFDINQMLWAGWAIKAPDLKIWFAGDTGFGPVFEREVAGRVGPVDVALVPAGAFLPHDVLRPVHVTPEEGLELARIMGAKTAIAMHWGTLPLGADLPKDAITHFMGADVPGVEKIMMRIGETRNFERGQLSASYRAAAPAPR